jgi:hypothetical protein
LFQKSFATVENGPTLDISWDTEKNKFKIQTEMRDQQYLDFILAENRAYGVYSTSFLGIGNGIIVPKISTKYMIMTRFPRSNLRVNTETSTQQDLRTGNST